MRSGLGQTQTFVPKAADTIVPPAVALATKEIPYDYVAKFTLKGTRGNRVQDVINISVEGGFVAVAIGYSFIPPRLPALPSPPDPDTSSGGDTVNFGPIVKWVLSVLRLPAFKLPDNLHPLPSMLLECHLVRLCGIDFKYSIVDSGTGRELQNQPIHNIAGLGESSGERPFRPFAKPMLFLPRSTIRIEVEEISEGPIYTGAELFIVLHGYKMLGYGTALP
ncbi:MAG: hypothetical protein ACREWG_11565 [Gammaproteobacteria bacterium]